MATTQRVSCNSMKSDAEALSVALKDIPKTIEQLQVSMRNLAQCWEGPAWAAFQMQVNRDIQNMLEVYEKSGRTAKRSWKRTGYLSENRIWRVYGSEKNLDLVDSG